MSQHAFQNSISSHDHPRRQGPATLGKGDGLDSELLQPQLMMARPWPVFSHPRIFLLFSFVFQSDPLPLLRLVHYSEEKPDEDVRCKH